MKLFENLLGKKKKELKAKCPISKEPIESGFGYLLTTSQIIVSRKYWDMIMTEPETLSYTVSHFKSQENGTLMRSLIFEKYSSISKPWIISDSCINLFEGVDKEAAKVNAMKWWNSDGSYVPEKSGPALEVLDEDTYKNWKDYAILEAGRSRVA